MLESQEAREGLTDAQAPPARGVHEQECCAVSLCTHKSLYLSICPSFLLHPSSAKLCASCIVRPPWAANSEFLAHRNCESINVVYDLNLGSFVIQNIGLNTNPGGTYRLRKGSVQQVFQWGDGVGGLWHQRRRLGRSKADKRPATKARGLH
jgi:hypothetical protein